MQITLYDVSGTENMLEGVNEEGNLFRLSGTLRFVNQKIHFANGKIIVGPPFLHGQSCEANIIDTVAILTIRKRIDQTCHSLFHMYNTQL